MFLEDLWGYKPDGSYILIWSQPDRASQFFETAAEAYAYAQLISPNHDAYVGVGLRPEAFPVDKRGGNDDVIGIGGLWLDIDIKHPVHQKHNLFENEEVARAFILSAVPLVPSTIIHSGHGLQVWWLFSEPWMFESAADRKSAADLARRWTNTFRFKAHEIGVDVDALHDLSRVMRIPGTQNNKLLNAPKSVYEMTKSDARYSPSDFEPYLLESPMGRDDTIIDVGDYLINPHADPPFMKFDLLSDNSIKFRHSWNHKRRDMGDTSLSSYDQSLASLAARAGWTAQEIVDLLMAHRRKYGDSGNHKNMHDYLTRTLRRAFMGTSTDARHEAVISDIKATEDPEERFGKLAELLGGVRIIRIIKYMSDPPTYKIETDSGSVNVGQITQLVRQEAFAAHIANATRRMIPRMKDDKWRDVVQTILDTLMEESAGGESTEAGLARAWLLAFLDDHRPSEKIEDALRGMTPFIENGVLYIFGQGLRRWLHATYGDRVDAKVMGQTLRALGCEPMTKGIALKSGDRTTRYVWKVATDKLDTFDE